MRREPAYDGDIAGLYDVGDGRLLNLPHRRTAGLDHRARQQYAARISPAVARKPSRSVAARM